MAPSIPNTQHGSALLEAVVAAGLLSGVLTGLVPLTIAVGQVRATSRLDLVAAQLARQRLGELQVLTHVTGAGGVVVTDVSTQLGNGGFDGGGAGLAATGIGPLASPLPGSSDWLDARGHPLAWSSTPPPGARYARRWAVVDDGGRCVRMWVWVSVIARPLRPQVVEAGAAQCPWGAAQP
ncbi:MAG TPA: hypothetical protein VMF13_01365 [Luteitalea sp.]|nr:hypothetical protein [Luteitalea sp.]